MRAPKIRAGHLDRPRPVPVSRAVTGPIRLVMVNEHRDRAFAIVATVTGIIAVALFVAGLAVAL